MKQYKIINSKIITPEIILTNHTVYIKNNIIESIIPDEKDIESRDINYFLIDGNGAYLSPGFIETHFHACGLHFTEDSNTHSLENMKQLLIKKGINNFIPTILYNMEALENLSSQLEKKPELRKHIPGIYMEGPFIDLEKRGGIPPEKIHPYKKELLEEIIKKGKGYLKMMVVSPSLEQFNEICDILEKNDIIPCLGHSNASINDCLKKIESLKHFSITHLFNAMSPITHRNPGLALLPFISDLPYFEIVGDGIHVDPKVIQTCSMRLNPDKMILISDAYVSAGLDYGKYTINGDHYLSTEKGVIREHDKILCGSNCLAPELLRRYRKYTNQSIPEAINKITKNPAALLKLNKGSIEAGKEADLIFINEEFQLIENLYSERR